MVFFWPGVLGEPKAFLAFCNSILRLAKEKRNTSKATMSQTNPSPLLRPYLKTCPLSLFQRGSP